MSLLLRRLGGVVTLTATSAGVATVGDTVVRARSRTAATTGVASVAVAVVRTRARAVTVAGVATVGAAVVRVRARSATPSGRAAVSVALVRSRALAATSTGTGSVFGTVSATKPAPLASAPGAPFGRAIDRDPSVDWFAADEEAALLAATLLAL